MWKDVLSKVHTVHIMTLHYCSCTVCKEAVFEYLAWLPVIMVWPVKVGASHRLYIPVCTFLLGHSCPRK